MFLQKDSKAQPKKPRSFETNFWGTVDGSKLREIKPVGVAMAKGCIQMAKILPLMKSIKESLFIGFLCFFTLSSIDLEVVWKTWEVRRPRLTMVRAQCRNDMEWHNGSFSGYQGCQENFVSMGPGDVSPQTSYFWWKKSCTSWDV